MGQKDIIDVFLEEPAKSFHIRGLAKQLGLPKTTVSYKINKLIKEKLLVKVNEGVFTGFRVNDASELFRFKKQQHAIQKIIESGLLDYIEEETNSRCIVLFGSFAKAEYNSKSDIDFFVGAEETSLDLSKFEKKLKHEINIIFSPTTAKMSAELLNNIANGVKLRGFLKVK